MSAPSADTSGLPPLDQPSAARMMIQYAPDGDTEIVENPPRFTWVPEIDDDARFVLKVSGPDRDHVYQDIPINYFTPPAPLAPGDYTWCYAIWRDGVRASAWSRVRAFCLDENLPETPLPPRSERFASVPSAHPRLWLDTDKIKAFRAKVKTDPEHCGWATFFEKSVKPWAEKPPIPEPAPYPDNKRVAPIWRQTYIDLQELIYAVRHQAIAGVILEDETLIANAKGWLLEAAAWDPDGVTSRAYTDEWAFRVNLALAWGYDWLHDHLSEAERETVRTALLARTRQVAEHCIENARISTFPYDSHAVRSVSLVLVPACLALLGDEPEAEAWLNFSVEFLWTVYSPWGDADGGWAEGTNYWMMGIAYLIDAANHLRSATGLDLFQRPFFQKTGDFPLYCKAPSTRRSTFGDDSTLGDPPGIKSAFNMRQFAGVTRNPTYQWYFDEIVQNDPGTEMAFYNWGWWDLNFDELIFRHDYAPIEGSPPKERMRHFRGIGWVGIQKHPEDPNRHIQFVFKSSRFGSISHSHGDQNAFCMSGYGEDLAIQSGHYVAFGSTMHMDWRRQTRSKNAILINGKGQYAEKDKAQALAASGRIVEASERDDHIFIRGDATAAYKSLSPEVTRAQRDVYFVGDEYFVLVDTVDADAPVTIDWLLHANRPFELGSNSFRYTGERAGFYGNILWSEAGAGKLDQITGFPGVDPKDYEGLPVSTHLKAQFPAAERHRIAVLLVPYALDMPKRVFSFLDDQGYDINLYLTDAKERSFQIVVPKSFAAT